MRNLIILSVLLLMVMSACNNDAYELKSYTDLTSYTSQKRTENEAIQIANKIMKQLGSTRGFSLSISLSYLKRTDKTRSDNPVPTLAYIINYGSNDGFVVIAADKRVEPLLAFSNSGKFDISNSIMNENFADRLESYLDLQTSDSTYNGGFSLDACFAVDPAIRTSLNQDSPWNAYIKSSHPNQPVGCVPVAIGSIALHCRDKQLYHKNVLNFKKIRDALVVYFNRVNPSNCKTSPKENILPFDFPYSIEEAVDSMAQILAWIGIDARVDYESVVGESAANSSWAPGVFQYMKLTTSQTWQKFQMQTATQYLSDNYLLYVSGKRTDNKGHAWVIDGCYYCIDPIDNTTVINSYVHCDWGWGGVSNGYFSGDVFATAAGEFSPVDFFAVKREIND